MPNPHAPRPWSWLSDQGWHALIPRSPAGRQIDDLRRRMDVIFRACRRANRMLGVPVMALARRLGLVSALNGPPAWMPDPDMSETRTSQLAPAFERRDVPQMKRLYWPRRNTRGRRNIPRAMRMVWP